MPIIRRIITSLVLGSVEAFLAFLCLAVGIPLLLSPQTLSPESVLALLPGWSIYPWAAGMITGGAFALGGIVMSEPLFERIGVFFLTVTTGVFSFALIPLLPGAFVGWLTFSLFSLSMAARYWVLGKLIVVRRQWFDENSKLDNTQDGG